MRRTEILSWKAIAAARRVAIIASGLTVMATLPALCRAQYVVRTVPTNAPNVGMVVNASQNTIYVTEGDNKLTVIDGATNTATVIADPGAANTSGASAMVTYLNGVFVVNKNSNDISAYYVLSPSGYNSSPLQQIFRDPNASQPVAIALSPSNYGKLFVANALSNTVSVFTNGTSGWQFTAAIPVGVSPQAIAFNPATNRVYVANTGAGTVSIIDGGSNSLITTVNGGYAPQSIAINSQTNKIYLTDPISAAVTIINGATNAVTGIGGVGASPAAITANPITNQIFVAGLDGKVAIIDGSTDTVTYTVTAASGTTPSYQASICVDTTTNLVYVTIQGGGVTQIDGTTGTFISTLATGNGGNAVMALNPVTHRAYVDSGSNGVTVVDGALNILTPLTPGQQQPTSLAVNPATNKIYVTNNGSANVTVIDGATNTVVDTVGTGTQPGAVAVDPAKNLIFVTNYGDQSVTIINGANDQTLTQSDSTTNADSIAVNPVLGLVTGASSSHSTNFNFPSNFGSNPWSFGPVNSGPIAVATNPAAGVAYTLYSSASIDVNDQSAPHGFNVGVCNGTVGAPQGMAVNTVTNTVYIACNTGEIDVLQGASGFFGGNETQFSDSQAISPVAIALNPINNKIYVANAGDGSGNGSLTVIDGATGTVTHSTFPGGASTPVSIAVNLASGKVYVQGSFFGGQPSIYVLDSDGTAFAGILIDPFGSLPTQLVADPINSTIYSANSPSNSVSAIAENRVQPEGLTTTVQPFAGNVWSTSATSTFTFTVSDTLDHASPYVVYFQVDSQRQVWNYAGYVATNTFSGVPQGPLAPGFHVVYAFTVSGDETGANSAGNETGFQNNPIVGSVTSYGFMVAPPIAGTPFYPLDFGTQSIGVQSAPQQPLLSNHGGVPLNFTYAISGPNAADFTEVAYTGTDKLCNALAGHLASGTFCDVNIAFKPSTSGPESAILTFTDNSLGVAGTTQTVQLTGSGQSGFALSANFTGNGSGSISDGGSLNCTSPTPCSQSYASGTVVTLTATATGGSIFYGWSGACSGSGTCSVTMNSAQSVSANFSAPIASHCAVGDTVWVGGASGNWSNAANWSTGVVPNGGVVHVCINNAHSPASQVSLDVAASIGGLTIDPGNSLTLGNNTTLSVAGTISNSGQINVVTSANGNNTVLQMNGAVTLSGGGTINLSQTNSGGQPLFDNVNNGSLTNVDNVIQGNGQIGYNGLIVTNGASGIINANTALPLGLTATGGALVNHGLIEASGSGVLQLSVTINNKNGQITTSSSAASISLFSGTRIEGGTLTNITGGFMGTTAGNTAVLDGTSQGALTNNGIYVGQNNSTTQLIGTINNAGQIQVVTAANGNNTVLQISGAVTLTGGGTVTLSQTNSGGQPIVNNANNGALTNVNNVIQGNGQLGYNGLIVTNGVAGIINANTALPLGLTATGGPLVNQGLIEASGTGVLQLSVTINNKNAKITTSGSGSNITLFSGATIQGGTLTNTAGGFMGTVAGNSVGLDGASQGALTLVGNYVGQNNSTTQLIGTINNTGSIQVVTSANGNNTVLQISGPVTLTGGGTVTLSQTNSGGQPIVNNANNGALTNVNNVIQGNGQFGYNGLIVTNGPAGIINANTTLPLGLTATGGPLVNQGLIEATGTGVLQLSVTINNKNAQITTAGSAASTVLYSGAIIQGGTLNNTGGGFLGSAAGNNVSLDGTTQGTLTNNGIYVGQNNSTTQLIGTINNTGQIQIVTAANGNNSVLQVNGAVTLTGAGTIVLSQTASGGQPIVNNSNFGALTNVNNVIQGSGIFGSNGLKITNGPAGVVNGNTTAPLQINGVGGSFLNNGLIEASGSGALQIYNSISNSGANITNAGGASSITLFSGATIHGGAINNPGGGFVGSAGGNTVGLDGSSQGVLTVTGLYSGLNNSTTQLVGTINNRGTIQILTSANGNNSILQISGLVTLTGGGTVILSQTASGGQPIVNNTSNGALVNANNLIEGSGQIGYNGLILTNQSAGVIKANAVSQLQLNPPAVTNQGLIIAYPSSTSGVLSVNNYSPSASGGFGVALGGLTAGLQYAQWHDTGTSALAGSLDIFFINGFTPALGNQFTILTAGAISGQFSSINSPSLPVGLGWSVAYNSQSVVLSVVAGVGGSSTLTITDLGTGTGTVTDNLGLISCTTTGGVITGNCSASYLTGSMVTLTATPGAGTNFNGWSSCSGTGTCTINVSGTQSQSATFVPAGSAFTLTVTDIGTGNGAVTDSLQQINCTDTAGVISGTCSASYANGTVVNLTATPSGNSTFFAWGGACTGNQACSVTVSSAQSVSASFAPPPQAITLNFAAGTNVTGMATYDCPSNPAPTPSNPCIDPNAHALALTVPQVLTPFTITVLASEVAPQIADGFCPNSATPSTDFDCRFKSYFTYSVVNSGVIVPLCYPYANGNCVHYLVYSGTPGTEPNPNNYVGPIDWSVSWNNDQFVPPAPYNGSIPRLYDDPDYAVSSTTPFGTNCAQAMLAGNPPGATNPPIYCQFEFDITTSYNPNKKVDAGITGRTKQFNDVVVAFPPANTGNLTVTTTPDAASVTAGNAIGFTIGISNSAGGPANNVNLTDTLPAGTNVNWSISPAYAGPGTCAITGLAGNQVLNCAFGNIAASQNFIIHVVSASSSAGSFTSTGTLTIGNQQILSIGAISASSAQPSFSGLTGSQTIPAGTASINLAGIIGSGTQHPAAGETISITINGSTQTATIGTNGAFTTTLSTANIPASANPYPIQYSFAGDSVFAPAADSSTTLTVIPQVANFTLTVTDIGTGNGTVTDSSQQINCTDTAGVISGSCSGTYTSGTVATLTATPSGNSSFSAWGGACTGNQACSVTMNSAQTVTASFVPPPQMITITFPAGSNVTGMATYDCPSNPAPTPTNPCTDPNAHAVALTIPQVLTPFTVVVQASEVAPQIADGFCPNSATPSTDFDCRFKTYFTYSTQSNGVTVPLCYPYANGNCVHYLVYSGAPGTEPNPSFYVGPIDWSVSWNNDHFVPPAPYTGSIPRLYDDPDYAVSATTPYGTNCAQAMLVGNPPVATNPPIYCQFEFDITTSYNPNKKVDAGITGRTKQFNDVVVAFPPGNTGNLTVTTTPDSATVTAGSPIGFTIAISNSAGGPANNVTLSDTLPAGSNVNWAISPAYSGPGSCAISGAVGSQILNCSFGNIAPSQSFIIHLLSSSSSAGTFTNTGTIVIGNQQILSIGVITAQKVASTTAIVSSTPNPSNVSQVVTINFTVGGALSTAPTGSVTVTASTGETCNGTLSAGKGTCAITFATAGIRTMVAAYGGDANYNSSSSAPFSQTVNSGTATALTISPSSVDFGRVVFGWFSLRAVMITNSGGSAVSISGIAIAKSGTDFYATSFCPGTLPPGKSCYVGLAYIPDHDDVGGAKVSTSLVVTSNAAGSPQSVPLTAVTIYPVVTVNPSSLSFAAQTVGNTSAAKTLTISNTGTAPLELDSLYVTGNFAIAAGTTCKAEAWLAPSQSCNVAVTFKPTAKGTRTGAITINDNAPSSPQNVPLSGTGK